MAISGQTIAQRAHPVQTDSSVCSDGKYPSALNEDAIRRFAFGHALTQYVHPLHRSRFIVIIPLCFVPSFTITPRFSGFTVLQAIPAHVRALRRLRGRSACEQFPFPVLFRIFFQFGPALFLRAYLSAHGSGGLQLQQSGKDG